MNALWREMHGVKIRLSITHGTIIRSALKDSVDVKQVVSDFLNSHPSRDITNDEARAWAKVHINVHDGQLKDALARVYAEGYVLGSDIGWTAVQKLEKAASAMPISVYSDQPRSPINWATWKPGNRAAANLINPPKALKNLMDSRGVTLTGIRGTTIDRIGVVLAKGLKQGLPPSAVAPDIASILNPLRQGIADKLGADVSKLMSDSQRALIIAQTEMSRAVSVASRAEYEQAGIEMVEWLVADPCDICAENADVSPIPIDEEFPSGDTEPPAHPNCMCAIAPYVVDTNNQNDTVG